MCHVLNHEHESYKKAQFFFDFVNSKLNQFQINTSMRQSDMTNNKNKYSEKYWFLCKSLTKALFNMFK